MNFIKYFLTLVFLFVGYTFADVVDSSEMAKMKVDGDALSVPTNSNMVGGYDASHRMSYEVSPRNQMYAKISYVISLTFCAATLVLFFIARLNAKKNYAKAKKFLLFGLALFAVAIATFFLPKLFLSTSFPGNFDMRAT